MGDEPVGVLLTLGLQVDVSRAISRRRSSVIPLIYYTSWKRGQLVLSGLLGLFFTFSVGV